MRVRGHRGQRRRGNQVGGRACPQDPLGDVALAALLHQFHQPVPLQGLEVVVHLLPGQPHLRGELRGRAGLGEFHQDAGPDGVQRRLRRGRVFDHFDVQHASSLATDSFICQELFYRRLGARRSVPVPPAGSSAPDHRCGRRRRQAARPGKVEWTGDAIPPPRARRRQRDPSPPPGRGPVGHRDGLHDAPLGPHRPAGHRGPLRRRRDRGRGRDPPGPGHPAAEPHLHLVLPHAAAGDPDPGGTEHPAPGRAPPRGGQTALPAHHARRHLHPGVRAGPAPEPAGPAGPHSHAPAGPHDRRNPAALHESRNPGQVPGALREAPGPEGIRVCGRGRARARAPRRRLPRGGPEPDDQVPQLPARRGDRRRTQRRDPDRAAADL